MQRNSLISFAAVHLYAAPNLEGRFPVKVLGFIRTTMKLSKKGVFNHAVWSYFMTIYGFGLLYNIVDKKDPAGAFTQPLDSVVASIYFSITTMATVGFGDFAPKSDIARVLVSVQILIGVAYSVFFLSIIAGFIRERTQEERRLADKSEDIQNPSSQ